MSSPVNEDVDKRYMYAPPWARETPQQSTEAIVAAVERLRLERQHAAVPSADDDSAGETVEVQHRDPDQHELPLGTGDVGDDPPQQMDAALA
jgi:hypothetical protein